MGIVLTGSIAYDYIMTFPGKFRDHILPDRLDRLSLSFLVDSMVRQRGGVAANIAYTLALLGERPLVMATVGEDFDDYRQWLDRCGVDTSGIRTIPGLLTASFFVNTDQANSQIASFYTGAMARAAELRFADLPSLPDLAVISPNDPGAMAAYVEECRRLGIPYLYDPSQQIVRLPIEALRQGIQSCRGLVVNDYEFALIEDKTGLDRAQILTAAEFLLITCGERGAVLHTPGQESVVPAVPERAVVDPTGVGDAFRAGFLKGYIHRLPLDLCSQMGALAATYCLENQGPQSHSFDLPEFIARFRRHFDDHGALDALL
jgi:adenosine kinase